MIIAYQNVQNVIQLMSCKCQTSLTALNSFTQHNSN